MAAQRSLMFLICILGIPGILATFIESLHPKSNCTNLRTTFANSCEDFLRCAIANSEPVTYCRKCEENFSSLVFNYNVLVSNETCKSKFIDRDRLNIMATIYSNAKSLWEAGSCSNCYDWVDPAEKVIKQNESEATSLFFDELSRFNFCVDKFNDSVQKCSDCMEDYNKVNHRYKEISKETADNICFDIKDAMNKTRLYWSHDLNCCKNRKSSLTAFIVCSSIIGVLIPITFYISFMFYGWRREQLVHAMIDSDVQPGSSNRLTNEPIEEPAIAPLLDIDST